MALSVYHLGAVLVALLLGAVRSGYAGAMFVVTWLCILGIFGSDSKYVLVFLGLSYGVYRLACRLGAVHSLVFVVLACLPMVSLKIGWHTLDKLWFLGLSFISFRAVGLMLDTRHNDVPVDFVGYTNFLMFPPAVVAGPIDRWHTFSATMEQGISAINRDKVQQGFYLMLLGGAMAVFGANWVQAVWLNTAVSPVSEAYAYAVYLYLNFGGYSNVVIGLGMLVGYVMPANFNAPYLARTPQDFWNRWHVSLSHWLRDYLFQPFYMACMRKPWLKPHKLAVQNAGIALVLITMGLWNGVEYHYVASGVVFAMLSIIHNTYSTYAKRGAKWAVFPTGKVGAVLAWFLTFNGAVLALYIFSGRMAGF